MKRRADIRLSQVRKLVVKPGEVLVLKSRKALPPGETKAIAEWLSRNLPGVSFLFMDETVDLKVVRKEKK